MSARFLRKASNAASSVTIYVIESNDKTPDGKREHSMIEKLQIWFAKMSLSMVVIMVAMLAFCLTPIMSFEDYAVCWIIVIAISAISFLGLALTSKLASPRDDKTAANAAEDSSDES